jgi:hypothetical protein
MEAPNNLDIFQPEQRMHIKTMRSIEKRRIIEQPKPSLDTSIGFPNTTLYRNQGTGNPTVTSKILLPTEDDTAMSPKPFLATMTLVMRSGIDVPAARKVSPITSGGIPIVSPVTVAHHTMRYENAAIQRILPRKVMMKNLRADFFLVSAFTSAIAKDDPTLIKSGATTSLESHCMVFRAEKSRRENCVC